MAHACQYLGLRCMLYTAQPSHWPLAMAYPPRFVARAASRMIVGAGGKSLHMEVHPPRSYSDCVPHDLMCKLPPLLTSRVVLQASNSDWGMHAMLSERTAFMVYSIKHSKEQQSDSAAQHGGQRRPDTIYGSKQSREPQSRRCCSAQWTVLTDTICDSK